MPGIRGRVTVWLVVCSALLLAGLGGLTAAARADAVFGVQGFDGQTNADAAGTPFTQAGGHPYSVSTEINLNTKLWTPPGLFGASLGPQPAPVEPTKDVVADIPPGLVGNPTSLAKCTADQLAFQHSGTVQGPLCPSASQVGLAVISIPLKTFTPLPVYNMVAPPNVPARFGFNVLGVVVTLDAQVRSGSDYGLSINAHNISEGLGINGTQLTLWGVPGDPSHDPDRACPGGGPPSNGGPSAANPGVSGEPACPGALSQNAFLRLPTSCPANPGQGLETSVHVDSWFHPGRLTADGTPDLSDPSWQSASFFSHLPPGLPDAPFPGLPSDQWGPQQGTTGCEQVPFDPTFTARPALAASPGASGYLFDLNMPQSDDPKVLGESDLKSATVTLPAGVRVNPASAAGLGACSPPQIALGSSAEPTCPDASKVGTVTIETPLLAQPLQGSVYLATPHQNPSGSLIAIYIVAKGPGVVIKLAGAVTQDATTGQMTASFQNQPQLPFSHLHLEFFGGDRAPLSNPARCGTYTTTAVMTGWSGKTVESDSSFTTSHDGHGAPCPGPQFHPTFSAGTTNPIAGRTSPLSVTIARSDEDQEIAGVDAISMPNGLTGYISHATPCKAADVLANTCGAASQIGTVTAAAGNGPNPFAVGGNVYLAGRYKHAPYSLTFVIPVKAGPFDLGTVRVRAAVNVDRHNATLKVVTDPLPTILQGIPLQVRLVNVTINRPRFIVNPTSCAQKQVTAAIRSTSNLIAHAHDRFQVTDCARLGFAPKLTFKVGGKGHLGHGTSTPLKTVLTMPHGDANLKSVGVSLPLALNARLDVVNHACTQTQFQAGHCEQARAGSAVAITPLLTHALRGGVYFVKDPKARKGALPNLIVALRGQVDFDLVSKITLPGGTRLATNFATIPDVPVTKFTLSFVSGPKGPLGVAENLCSTKAKNEHVTLTFHAQNGKTLNTHQPLTVTGCHTPHH